MTKTLAEWTLTVQADVDVSEAYISIEPYWMKKKYDIDLNIIDPKNYGIDFYGDLIFTTEKEIKEHPKRVEAFTRATIKGWKYALKHKEKFQLQPLLQYLE